MLDVLYYFTELLKFLCIYVFGFGMQIASNKIRKVWAVVLTILYGAVMTIYKTSNLYPLFYIGYVLLVSYLLIVKFNWKKIRIAVWAMCVITGLDTMSFVVTRFLWSWVEVPYMQIQDLVGSMITLSILFFMFYGILRKRNTVLQELSARYCIVFFLVCLINECIFAIFEVKIGIINVEYILLCIALFISTLAQMAFVLLLSVSNNRYKENTRLKEEYLNLQKEHYQYLEAKNMETRKFRHDMRSHMLIIKEQIKLEKWEALDKYIDTICEKLEYVPGYISVQNEIVDAILNYYNMQFKENQVVFKVSGKMPKDCFIEAYDLCAIFANVLSNALEAAVKTNEKTVELIVRFEDDILFICEKNAFDGRIKIEGDFIVTDKEDKNLHGFGIQNIKDSVKKYGGEFSYEVLKDLYILNIIMENRPLF